MGQESSAGQRQRDMEVVSAASRALLFFLGFVTWEESHTWAKDVQAGRVLKGDGSL